jgi:RNA recognition motif-containing protein
MAAFSFKKESVIKNECQIICWQSPKIYEPARVNRPVNQAGEVIVADLITDRKNGESKGFAFVTMSTRREAEKAIHMFNTISLSEQQIKVIMAKSSFQL